MKTFTDKAIDAIKKKKSVLCVGFDPQVKYIPKEILQKAWNESKNTLGFEPVARAFVAYNAAIAKAVAPYAAFAKPQMAFYEKYGNWGVWAFEETKAICEGLGLVTLEDAKRSDGGDTAEAYAEGHLGKVDVWDGDSQEFIKKPSFNLDAMTVTAYIGSSCVNPFVKVVKEFGKGIFIVDKTSFDPNSEVEQMNTTTGRKVWEELAFLAWNWGQGTEGEQGYRNVGVVMGATYPEDADTMREILGENCFFLIPGYGAQGGGAAGAVRGINKNGLGGIVNSSRGIIFAYREDVQKGKFACDPKDFAKAAANAADFSRDELNTALINAGKMDW